MPVTRSLKLVWLTVNRRCNFRCLWCYASASEYKAEDEMSLADALEYLQMIKDIGIKKIFLIGGEPTLWSSLFDFNDALQAAGIKSVIVTNALRFSDDQFWDNYLEHANSHIGVSFKAFSPESLIANTKVATFESVTKGLKRVFAYQQNSVASFVYSKPYVSHFLDMVKYAVHCGAYGVSVNFCSPAVHRDHVDPAYVVEIDNLVREITESYEEANAITKERLVFVMKHPLCIWPKTFIETLKCRGQIQTMTLPPQNVSLSELF
jgi:MoaA/NifB/PqqE/SkfB family radical SAM enzyme